MRVFISWSGRVSQNVAETLSQWLEHVVRGIDTFVSTQDIDAGDRWEATLSEELNVSHHAVLCITKDNQTAPWLLYEAGSLGKLVGRTKVIPYTIGFSPQELAVGPLSRFQGVQNDRAGTWKLVCSLNSSLPMPKEKDFIREDFDLWWPRLQEAMTNALVSQPSTAEDNTPSDRELLLELREDMNRVLRHIRQNELSDIEKIRSVADLASRDSLTQLPNRRMLKSRANELVASQTPYMIATLDLDKFKVINDAYGHHEGDRVLTIVASSLTEVMRAKDLVVRFGGEEFIAMFVDTSLNAASEVMLRYVAALPHVLKEANAPATTVSVGVSGNEVEALETKLQHADTALSRAKTAGGNRVVFYN